MKLISVTVAAAAVSIGLIAGVCSAQTPPEALEWMVLNEINSAWFDRSEPFNRPALVTRVPAGVIRALDVSHDGKPDWLIDYTDSGLMYCGTGGCLRTLYVSDGDDYVLAFDEQSDTFALSSRGGETVIDARVHPVFCNGETREDCAFAWTWDTGLKALVERPTARGVTLLANDGGFVPIGEREGGRPVIDSLPAELATIWRETLMTCLTPQDDDGVRIFRATFKSVPDLNSDGARDWLARLPSPCQADPDDVILTPGFKIFLTQPDGGLGEAWTSEPDQWATIDIGTTPAQLISNPACGNGLACPNVQLRWDSRSSSFVPAE